MIFMGYFKTGSLLYVNTNSIIDNKKILNTIIIKIIVVWKIAFYTLMTK